VLSEVVLIIKLQIDGCGSEEDLILVFLILTVLVVIVRNPIVHDLFLRMSLR
jgi:hypothetical protein